MPKVAPIRDAAESEALPVNPIVKYASLELNGMEYKLCWDFNAIAVAEEITGQELLLRSDPGRITAKQLRGMLYAAMLRAQPSITLDHVTELITFKHAPIIANALTQAWIDSNQEPEKNGNGAEEELPGE